MAASGLLAWPGLQQSALGNAVRVALDDGLHCTIFIYRGAEAAARRAAAFAKPVRPPADALNACHSMRPARTMAMTTPPAL